MKDREIDEKALEAVGASANTPHPPGDQVVDIESGDDNDEKRHESVETEDGDAKAEDDEKEKQGGLKDYWRIFRYADRQDILFYVISIGFSIASGAALPLMTLVFGGFTTDFSNFQQGLTTPDAFRNRVDTFVLWFIWLFIARFFLAYICNVLINIAAVRVTRAIRTAFLESTLRQEIWHFDKQSNGSAATQVTTNGNRINQGIAEKLAAIVQGISLFFSSFIIAIAVQWKLALICMTIVPALFLVVGGCIAVDAKQEARITRFYSRAAVLAQDAISSVRTIHAFGAQSKIVEKYDEYLKMAHKEGWKKSPVYGILFSSETFLVFCATALAFWQGYRMYAWGEIESVGTVFTVVLSVAIGTTSISLVAPQQQAISNAASAASELFLIIDKKSLLDPLSKEGKQPNSCEGHIEVKNLSFCYPQRPDAKVLTNLTLSIPAGKTTALVGPSGCGKSTLIGLLERWYQYGGGQILLDGMELSEYNTKWLRSNIRLVQQEPVLFSGTVFENVAKGLVGEQLNLTHDKKVELVQEACKKSNAHDFIMELPEGYDTQVGERASMLSGGQRQRVAIARSIISDPKVLLLDEATSALDPTAEKVVQAALNKVSVNKTTLIIAHKLATVKAADNIAVMKDGVVFEQGSHKELIERNGQYAAMVRAQDLGAKAGEAELTGEDDDSDNDNALERPISLQRTKTEAASSVAEKRIKNLTSGTLNYGLAKCVWIMFAENPKLYWCYAVSICGCLIGGGTYPAQAILFSRLIGVFAIQDQAEAQSRANLFALMFFVLAIANLFAYFAIGWVTNTIGQEVTHRYRKEMVERVINFDQDFFDRAENSSGSLTSKLSSVPTSLQELISANIMLMFIVLVNLTASSILGIAYGWKLGLVVVFGGLPLLVGSGYVRIRLDQKLEADAGERFAESAGLATEAVTSIRTISSLTLENNVMKEYSDAMGTIVKSSTKGFLITMFPYALSQSLEFLVLALGFWYGSRLLASYEYTTDQFFVVFIAVVFGGQAAGQFFGYSSSITKARSAANYILWLRTVKAKIRETPENEGRGPSGEGPIEMQDVEFRYIQRHASRVLRGISMKIDPGQYVAFVGPSGCGKSTLVSLLERFYDPTSGRITLNEDDIATMSPQLYRGYMSLVQQEPPLYQGSVRENISLGLQYEPSDEEVNEALRQSNGLEFVSSLPEGLETPCGSKGLQFSGGQRQRIAVARALIRKPRLLLLDEATSALDTQSERVVQKALDEAASSRTTIAVAHRLSTIRHANTIYVIADGKIAEMGTHEELQALRGRYYAMCLAQSLDQA
ncbi:ABC multidrug transporter MDR5 [Pseudocercospora fuligena]|uniref:ABC multidrug transporter MDR5 n=1 Tax=Pseudocercospora fuligena TaxID=685502 RepID=A0A8H6VCF1_9PEZI|nr:ABC multidrug transporter MDR5 [Pseudocercospora fuligena]